MNAGGYSTANVRGYITTYHIDDKKLFLQTLQIGYIHPNENGIQEWKTVNGVKPEKWQSRGRIYDNIDLLVDFTGGLLIAREFDGRFYAHVGFQIPVAYEIIYDMRFNNGRLIETIDHSEKASEWREEFSEVEAKYLQKSEELYELGLSYEEKEKLLRNTSENKAYTDMYRKGFTMLGYDMLDIF